MSGHHDYPVLWAKMRGQRQLAWIKGTGLTKQTAARSPYISSRIWVSQYFLETALMLTGGPFELLEEAYRVLSDSQA